MTSFYDALISESDFSTRDKSWSPFFSTVGICAGGDITGIGELVLHYNRVTRPVFGRFIGFPLKINRDMATVERLWFGNSTSIVCPVPNVFIFESFELPFVTLFEDVSPGVRDFRSSLTDDACVYFTGFSRTTDARDPDPETPFGLSLFVQCGHLTPRDGTCVVENDEGLIRFCVHIDVLTHIQTRPTEYVRSMADSLAGAAPEWDTYLRRVAACFPLSGETEHGKALAAAARSLIMNTCETYGGYPRYRSCFPSRGEYPCHFLWDTYFQNLGYGFFDKSASVGFLMLIAGNCRYDGKLPQFICSTWARPGDSQPPLLGWAVMKLIESIDKDDLNLLFAVLVKNCSWWLNARMSRFGLIFSPSGLETGQDDSPRFDGGAAVPCDMNAYLLNQMRCIVSVAPMVEKDDVGRYWKKRADEFEKLIYEKLYCPEDGLFYDLDLATGQFIRVRSNACVMPLWAGVKMPENQRKFIIEEFLLNEKAMFGAVPFPSVAYDDKHYDPSGWWRGPTWMPIAYLMCETLEKYGYNDSALEAKKRLYDIILRDGEFRELFDSRTGKGLGAAQQGWTCGIFIRLSREIFLKDKI